MACSSALWSWAFSFCAVTRSSLSSMLDCSSSEILASRSEVSSAMQPARAPVSMIVVSKTALVLFMCLVSGYSR